MSVIEIKDVTKKFKVYYDKGNSLKERIIFRKRNSYEDRWVLKGVTLNIEKGEAVGLIGENGSGKSTLLKLMTKIMFPESGSIKLDGRVSSLLELGAGFHPDMSGRENIYINASIFGLSKKEIDGRLKKIIDFSELSEYIDNPVRTYSSGMYMRLAFSVAINVDADILLIDEILAVGDANFQAKCFNRLREVKAKGTTIVIVSHSLGQIEQFCDRSIWLKDGKIEESGDTRTVHRQYLDFMGQKRVESFEREAQRLKEENTDTNNSNLNNAAADHVHAENSDAGIPKEDDPIAEVEPEIVEETAIEEEPRRFGTGEGRIVSIASYNAAHKKTQIFKTGEKAVFDIEYEVYKTIDMPVVGFGFYRNDNLCAYGTNSLLDKYSDFVLESKGHVYITFDKLNLLPGIYSLDVALQEGFEVALDWYKGAYQIEMYSDIQDIGFVRIDHNWEIAGK